MSPDDKFDPFKFLNQLFAGEDKNPDKNSPSKAVLDKKRLIDELEKLTHSQRIYRMYVVGKASSDLDSPNGHLAKRVIAELYNGEFYERYMALASCHGSHDAEIVFKATKDASKTIRATALTFVASTCSDAQVISVLQAQSGKTQRVLLKDLRKGLRVSLIDQFIETLVEGPTAKLVNALFFGSADCVKKYIEQVGDRLNSQEMARFASWHPQVAIQYLEGLARQATTLDWRLVALAQATLSRIAALHPDACIKLVARLKHTIPAAHLNLRQLFNYRPNEMIDLFAEGSELSALDLGPTLRKVNASSLAKIIQANALKPLHHNGFRKLSPDKRRSIYEYCSEGWRDTNGCLAGDIIDQMPEDIRRREAKRHLALPSLAARMADRLAYARYLPWSETLEILQPILDSSEVDTRKIGFRCLLPIVRFEREHSQDLLDILVKRKKESDPVRLEFLYGLSQLPPSIWGKDQLDTLSSIIKDALSASDLSQPSVQYIGSLVIRLFRFHRQWSADWIAKLARERGALFIASTLNQFSAEELRYLAEQLTPAVTYWASREEEGYLSYVARWYGHRLEEFPALIGVLNALCKKAKSEWVSLSAAAALREHVPARYNELVPQLLSLDKSWAVKPVVFEFLHYRRQDLLTPYLGQNNFPGRFSTGKTRLIPDFTGGFQRWTSKQHQTYGKQLARMAQDKDGDVGNRIFGITRLCLLPEPPMDVLQALASTPDSDEKEAVFRDYAINHLGDLDGGQGVPILMEAVHDSRARLAIYAVRKAVLSMHPEPAMKILEQVPSTKISVFKEVIRLVGELKSDSAFAWLVEQSQQNLHKDLQVALLRSLWNYPDKDQTWEIMHRALDSGNASYFDTAIRMPSDSLSSSGRDHLLGLFHKALLCTDPEVRVKALTQVSTLSMLDSKKILLESLLKALNSQLPDEMSYSGKGFFRLYANQDQAVMKKGLLTVASNTRALVGFLTELENGLRRQRSFLLADGEEILKGLRNYPKTVSWQIRIAAFVLPWPKYHKFLKELDTSGDLDCDTLSQANSSLTCLYYRSDADEFEQFERDLAAEESASLRRIALAALVTLGNTSSGWTRERLDHLMRYRADSSLMVSSTAEFTLPAVEIQLVTA